MSIQKIADCINILGEFCGKRDVPELTQEQLQKKYGISQVDVMVLFESLCENYSNLVREANPVYASK